jgi:type I site-specific restriction-modification system R (restriction) subunit
MSPEPRTGFTESVVEEATLGWLAALGYAVLHGPAIAAGEPAAERSDPNYRDVVLQGRLRQALARLNPGLPHEALDDACRKLLRAEARGMPQRNLAVELLEKLLRGEIRTRSRRNVVQARSFAEMLEQALRRYQNRAVGTAKVIEELIDLARVMRQAGERGEALGLGEDEVAFYDALETNDSAVSTGRCGKTSVRNCGCW